MVPITSSALTFPPRADLSDTLRCSVVTSLRRSSARRRVLITVRASALLHLRQRRWRRSFLGDLRRVGRLHQFLPLRDCPHERAQSSLHGGQSRLQRLQPAFESRPCNSASRRGPGPCPHSMRRSGLYSSVYTGGRSGRATADTRSRSRRATRRTLGSSVRRVGRSPSSDELGDQS